MNIILAADGHVGSATAKALLAKGQAVTVVLHSEKNVEKWQQQGAETVIVDINDPDALGQIFNKGQRAFILNPPAAPSTDTVAVEKKSVKAILKALKTSEIKKIVVESTYGAQPGNSVGDLGVLYELEQGIRDFGIPVTVIRAAYYMSNWDLSLKAAKGEGVVHTLYPVDFKIPMVATEDIGHFAAKFLTEPIKNIGIEYVEGPEEYSSNDVAAAFSTILGQDVKAVETPQAQWIPALKKMDFSDVGAKSMVAMTKTTLDKKYEMPDEPNRGGTTLEDYIRHIVKAGK
jgi:uncharacterized protein YbjT (DUF2867 family)